MRSLFINLELMLRIEDAGFAAQMREFVTRETANCQEITWALHRERTGVLARFLGRISYVLVGALDYTVTRRLNLPMRLRIQIGSASCMERGCPYVWISVGGGPIKKT